MKQPVNMDPSHGNLLVVGDGGKDKAAEEYVYSPPGSSLIVAPKLSKNEKPSMSNAVAAIANIALKGREKRLKHAASGITVIGRDTKMGQSLTAAGKPLYTTGSFSGGVPTSPPATPMTPIVPPVAATPASSATPSSGPMAAPRFPEYSDIRSLIDSITQDASGEGRFGSRPGFGFAANGAIIDKLKMAAGGAKSPILSPGGMVVGYTTNENSGPSTSAADSITAYQQAQLDLERQALAKQGNANVISPYQQAQLDIARSQSGDARYAADASSGASRYSTDAQRAIAQMNINAQMAQLAATNKYNTQRLALEKLLGEGQLNLDTKRAAQEAMQLLMTRAGRQMVAPGGDVIPSMQPLIGRSIN